MAGCIAHNLNRTMQMKTKPKPKQRKTTPKRAPLWVFQQINTFRRNIVNRAERVARPQGKLTLTISGNNYVENEYREILEALD
jgi:hypothetical protein